VNWCGLYGYWTFSMGVITVVALWDLGLNAAAPIVLVWIAGLTVSHTQRQDKENDAGVRE